jgi:hypothetical protein
VTPFAVVGTLACMDDLERQYLALVERVRSYPMTEAARAVILTEIEATYRRERDAAGYDGTLDSIAKSLNGRHLIGRPSKAVSMALRDLTE